MSLDYLLTNCTLCKLSSNAACIAPLEGAGRLDARYMIVTLNPSSTEDSNRKHFPHDEGMLLEAMLNSVALSLRAVSYTHLTLPTILRV